MPLRSTNLSMDTDPILVNTITKKREGTSTTQKHINDRNHLSTVIGIIILNLTEDQNMKSTTVLKDMVRTSTSNRNV